MKRFHVHAHVEDLQASFAWEHFHTLGSIPTFGQAAPEPATIPVKQASSCC